MVCICSLRFFDIQCLYPMATRNNDLFIDWPAFIEWFNHSLKLYGSKIPPIKYITKGKKSQVQRLVNEIGTKQLLVDAVIHMCKSDFLNGQVKTAMYTRGFIASFVWLVENNERLADVANGRYDNPPEVELTPEEKWQIEKEQRAMERERRKAEALRIEEEEREARRRQLSTRNAVGRSFRRRRRDEKPA